MPYRSLYIHIPFCISKCSYCDFFSVPVREVADDYVEALCNEIRFRLCDSLVISQSENITEKKIVSNQNIEFGAGEGIRTVYIGGGTPSLLSPAQLKKITDTIYESLAARPQTACSGTNFISQLIHLHRDNRPQTACSDSKNNFQFSQLPRPDSKPHPQLLEFTVEVNPDDVTSSLLHALSDCGVNRVSCGIQSLNDEALSFCRRRANRKQILSALDLFEKEWNGELSLDLISALPRETEKSFLEGLEIVTATKANHISLYSLTIEEETPLGKMVEGGNLLYNYDDADKMWLLGRDFLKAKGFEQYEVSNFCKDGKMSIHNLSYWNHESYIGCGSGGCGTKHNADGTAFRWTNTTNIKEYIDFWKTKSPAGNSVIPQSTETLSRQTEIFEFFMMGLRKLSGVNESHFEKIFGEPFPPNVKKLFQKWSLDGKAKIEGGKYSLTESGILYLNRFLEEL